VIKARCPRHWLTPALAWLMLPVLIWGGALPSRSAFALLGDGEKAFGLDGSIRTLFFVLDRDGTYPFSGRNEIDALSQTVLRLTAAGRPAQSFSYEVHWVQSVTAATERISGGSLLTVGNTSTGNVLRYRVLDTSWTVLNEERAFSTASMDRMNVKTSLGWGDVTLGRQAITFGKTYFWNPLDVFFPFGSSQFDRDYKPGVDALRVDIPFGPFSGLNLVGAAGPKIGIGPGDTEGNDPQDASWYGSALLGRLFANRWGWDFSLQAGKVFGGVQLGVGTVGDWGPVQIRAEGAQFLAMSSDPLPAPLQGDLFNNCFVGVIGLGRRFESGLSLDFEYLYNGAGDPNRPDAAMVRTQFGASLQMGRHLTGLAARYEFSPLVTGQLALINSLSDGSAQLQPLVNVSLSNEMDLLIGMTLNFGPSPKSASGTLPAVQSEFGTIPDLFFLEWKYYF